MTPTNRLSIVHPVFSVICLLLIFAALHDIGNITETDLSQEYAAVGCCLAWFVVLAIGLLRRRRHWLGAVTLIAVAVMTSGQVASYGSRLQASTAEQLATRGAFVALVIVTVALFSPVLRDIPGRTISPMS